MNPGPWKRTGGIVTDANDVIVAQCWANVTGNKPTWQECAENAQLIAAAPDLLEACQDSLDMLSGLSTDGEITMTPEGKDAITAQLRAVIGKATT